ncbi:PorH family porin [Corynebacterium sp. HMSC05E07]|uniref:PorH family porin n=1 Tax=Corynebacterium sp. HMSC05E07 TaxID=1581117 RepID=UPI0014393B53|nr:PorH family porin [Corynebacterium sp. HMSC05E07]
MDLSFIGDQLDNFATFAGGIKDLFKGFAGAFDAIAGAATSEDADFGVHTEGLEALSSK